MATDTTKTRAQHLAAARRAHEAVAKARRATEVAVGTRTAVLHEAHAADITWDDLAAELGVTRPRVIDMARDKAARNARRGGRKADA